MNSRIARVRTRQGTTTRTASSWEVSFGKLFRVDLLADLLRLPQMAALVRGEDREERQKIVVDTRVERRLHHDSIQSDAMRAFKRREQAALRKHELIEHIL